MSGGCEENAAGSLFKVHGHGCAAALTPDPPAPDWGLSAVIKALPVPPWRGGLVLVLPSPGVTSHLPNASVEGEHSRLLKCRGRSDCGEGKGSRDNRAGNVDWAAAAVINSAAGLTRGRKKERKKEVESSHGRGCTDERAGETRMGRGVGGGRRQG